MDVRNWSINQIMQLPDEAFGQRFVINFSGLKSAAAWTFFISEIALPNHCVLWELQIKQYVLYTSVIDGFNGLALLLGDQLPATLAIAQGLENMFPGCDLIQDQLRVFGKDVSLRRLRIPYAAQGRRVVLAVNDDEMDNKYIAVSLVFSSIPTEVPDCLLSV